VTVGTVTAQLLYEIQSERYSNPDVVVRLDTVRVEQEGPDRVRIFGTRGEPAPATAKVAINYRGGWRNTMTLGITGLDVEKKAQLALDALWASIEGGREAFDEVDVQLLRYDREDPSLNEEAISLLRITVADRDRNKVGRAFSNRVIELLLSNYPGFFATTPPTEASEFGVYFPALVPADLVQQEVVVGGRRFLVPATTAEPCSESEPVEDEPDAEPNTNADSVERTSSSIAGATVRLPLGRIAGARSGDKGGNANVGVWVRSEEAFRWLRDYLTVQRLRDLLPETRKLKVRRYELPNLLALNFVIEGLLGRGVAASTRIDQQAKGLGEYLRAKLVDVPAALVESAVALDRM
jgi:hypothetical protein